MPWNKHFRDSKAIITRTLELAHASESESTRILERYDSIVDSTVEALNAGDIYIGIMARDYALGIEHKFTPRVFKWCIIAKLKEEGLPIDDLHADIIQTMIPADAPRWTAAKQPYFDAIYKRIKWRLRQVSDSGLDLAIFENVPTDTPLSDDLSIIQSAKQTAQSRDESAQATQSDSNKRKKHIRYPQDDEARKALEEAARRKRCKSYSGDSNADIIKHMIEEPQSKWAARILYGKLKGKANGQGREQTKPLDKDKAAETWGKHLSAYLKDHPPKQGA